MAPMLKHAARLIPLYVMGEHKRKRRLAQFANLPKSLRPSLWLQGAIVYGADRFRKLQGIHRASFTPQTRSSYHERVCSPNVLPDSSSIPAAEIG
jgi:hypothetical protein